MSNIKKIIVNLITKNISTDNLMKAFMLSFYISIIISFIIKFTIISFTLFGVSIDANLDIVKPQLTSVESKFNLFSGNMESLLNIIINFMPFIFIFMFIFFIIFTNKQDVQISANE